MNPAMLMFLALALTNRDRNNRSGNSRSALVQTTAASFIPQPMPRLLLSFLVADNLNRAQEREKEVTATQLAKVLEQNSVKVSQAQIGENPAIADLINLLPSTVQGTILAPAATA
jgi:hypothetical protein